MAEKVPVSEKILMESTRLFARQGFDGTSIKEIADAVGIKKPSLLYHFESKEVLRHAVLTRVFGYWSEAVPRLMHAATTGDDRFDSLMTEATTFFTADPNRSRLLMREMLDRPEQMRGLIADYLRPWLSIVGQYIERGQQEGILHADVDADAYVLHVIQMILASVAMHDVMVDVYDANSSASLRRHLEELIRMARRGLFCQPGAQTK